MDDTEYNLLDEKWIRVLTNDGAVESVGMKEFFSKAHEYKSFGGEMPTQDFAVMRVLLAVIYSVYQRMDENGEESALESKKDAIRRWVAIWSKKRFNSEFIDRYLERYRERFFMFHPKRPFFQAPISTGTDYYVPKLNGELSESSNKIKLFSTVGGQSKKSMEYGEAMRWLLHINAFDDTSAKPSKSSDKKFPSPGPGWLGKIGPVFIEGNNLFETLLLNLVLVDDRGEVFSDGKAVWERDDVSTSERVEIPLPQNPVELLTLQSRRLLLRREDAKVTGFVLLGGDIVQRENALTEQMTMWKKNKEGQWVPKMHSSSRAMWRDYQSLLIKSQQDGNHREPGVLSWATELVAKGVISYNSVRIRIAGVEYGDKNFFIDNYVSDSLSLNKDLLSSLGDSWNFRIVKVIEKTEWCVNRLGKFVGMAVLVSMGVEDKDVAFNKSKSVRSSAYYSIDQPFRLWLGSIDPLSDDMDLVMSSWLSEVESTIISIGKGVLNGVCEKAIVGKDSKNNIFVLFNSFKSDIYRITRGSDIDG